MRIILYLLIITLIFPFYVSASSVRALGMGNIYPLTARDPSGIFYNPAYLAKSDAIRLSLDNLYPHTTSGVGVYGPTLPRNNIALSIGDLGIARSSTANGATYYVGSGFNTYSFLRLGIGVKFSPTERNIDLGFDADITRRLAVSAALINEKDMNGQIALKTDDSDQCLIASIANNRNFSLGYENQITSRAFWRIGYNSDHPTAGLTVPIHQYADLDLALDLEKDNSKFFWGINLFRNTENKRVNSNHSINFGKAIIGEDKFINIEGFNIHYVDTGLPTDAQRIPPNVSPDATAKRPTLVLIGGGIHFSHHWDAYIPELAKHYRVINIDHLGAGESDKPDYYFNYTVAEQAELINELLNRIGIKEASLLGYCYGGSICFYLAGNYPERYKKLVIIEGFVRGINTIPPSDKFRPGALKMRHDVEFLSSYLVRDYVTFNFRLLYPYFNGKMWYQLNKDVLYIDLREDIRNLKAPVLYYAGTKSWAYDFLRPTKDYLKANVKDLKFIEIEGAEHEVDSFNRERFMKEVLGFLAPAAF